MESLLEKTIEALQSWGPNVLAAVGIFVAGWFGSKILAALCRRALTRSNVDETLVRFAGSLVSMSVLALFAIAALGRLGVNTTSFAAVIAAAGLAVGLAFQGTLSNFSAGVLVIVFRPFKAGDFVEVGGVSGSVEAVHIFTTELKTPDNKKVIVGNADVMGSVITNYSAYPTRRVDMVFGIAYEDDIAKAKRVIEEILRADDRVLDDPAPAVIVVNLGDSSVDIAARPWCRGADYWGVMSDVTERVKLACDAEGISIPFPQRDVHVVTPAQNA